MGWYDAFRGKSSNVNLKLDKSGNAMSAFGDAFSKFGKVMEEDRIAKEKTKLIDSQLAGEKLEQEINTQKKTDMETKSANDAESLKQTKFDDAYESEALSRPNRASFDANWQSDGTMKPSADAMSAVNKHFKEKEVELEKADKWAQSEVNEELKQIYGSGGYKSFEELKKANPDIVDIADGTTVMAIKDAFKKDDVQEATLKAQEKDTKHQIALLKKEKEIIKLQKSNSDKNFKYTENTGVKIRELVKTASGMDNTFGSFDDAQPTAFEKKVTDVATLSKELNLEPILALKAYNLQQEKAETKDNPNYKAGTNTLKYFLENEKSPKNKENIIGLNIRK